MKKKGERKYFLKGTVLDKETGTPIVRATVTILLGVNEEVAIKTDIFGQFRLSNLPSQVKLNLSALSYSNLTIAVPTYKTDSVGIIVELETKPNKPEPVVIDNLSVWIEQEITIEMGEGTRINKAQYTEFSKNEVLKRIVTLNDLTRIWTNQRRRDEFTKDLIDNSVSPKTLAALLDAPDADPFDILAHIAFGTPIISRDERAEAFLNKKRDYMKSFGETGRRKKHTRKLSCQNS